jgi:hypothetical protein
VTEVGCGRLTEIAVVDLHDLFHAFDSFMACASVLIPIVLEGSGAQEWLSA